MNVVSLFAGCGGLDLGFEQAGFNVVWANEFDQSIHATYRHNHPHTQFCGDDIRTIKSEDIPDCDGIIGGPPCQSWSVGGRGRGFDDERGKLFLDYIRIVEDNNPKFFLIENVAGILEEKHKPAFSMFLKRLENAGYKVQYSLLNASDFVIPQDRFRVFIVGTRKDLNLNFEFPSPSEKPIVTLKSAIGDIFDIPQFSDGEISTKMSEHGLWNHDVYIGPYSANYMHSNRVRSWNETSFTIQAQASNTPQHPQAPKMTFSINGGREFKKGFENLYRRLSIRECARIQTFPDHFRFIYNDVKDGYKMVGNAVPPRLAYFLALQLKKALKNETAGIPSTIKPISYTNLEQNTKLLVDNGSIQKTSVDNDLIDSSKNVLLCLVKTDNVAYFANQSARMYYTGKQFPSSIALNNLYFFMPYIKGKGVKDLYFIKKARVGKKSEIYPDCDDNSMRLVFEIEFVKQLFAEYMPIRLNIWNTFTDTKISTVLSLLDTENQ